MNVHYTHMVSYVESHIIKIIIIRMLKKIHDQ